MVGNLLVVFDLDGTLVDTLPAIAEAMNAVLREEGLPEWPREKYRRFAGDGAAMLVKRATSHQFDHDDKKVAGLLQMFRERDEKTDEQFARPYDGVREALESLAADGATLAILSNKEHPEAWKLVEREFGIERFAAVRGVTPGAPLKPDPTVLLDIMAMARSTPTRTVYVGDTDTDMRTGRNAGVFTVGCAWGFRDADELRSTGADVVIASPRELPGVARARSRADAS